MLDIIEQFRAILVGLGLPGVEDLNNVILGLVMVVLVLIAFRLIRNAISAVLRMGCTVLVLAVIALVAASWLGLV